jgi:hypothetical protein
MQMETREHSLFLEARAIRDIGQFLNPGSDVSPSGQRLAQELDEELLQSIPWGGPTLQYVESLRAGVSLPSGSEH